MEVRTILVMCLAAMMRSSSGISRQDVPHSRQKRILWITNDGRLAFPPGTSLVISPSLSMPFIRYPPPGFFSNLTMSLPFTIDFDKLGLTDNENPYGDLSPLFSRSIGRAAGGLLANFVGHYLDRRRGKRSTTMEAIPPNLEEKLIDYFHGGERALLYGMLEDMLSNFGLAGKPCLLRAICEIHAHPLKNFGLLGEMAKLFLTATKSPYNHLMEEYVSAEKAGSGAKDGPGECWPYHKDCPKSIFLAGKNKYSEHAEDDHRMEEDLSNDVENVQEITLAAKQKIDIQPM